MGNENTRNGYEPIPDIKKETDTDRLIRVYQSFPVVEKCDLQQFQWTNVLSIWFFKTGLLSIDWDKKEIDYMDKRWTIDIVENNSRIYFSHVPSHKHDHSLVLFCVLECVASEHTCILCWHCNTSQMFASQFIHSIKPIATTTTTILKKEYKDEETEINGIPCKLNPDSGYLEAKGDDKLRFYPLEGSKWTNRVVSRSLDNSK